MNIGNNNKLHSQVTFITSKLAQVQARNLLTFLACSIVLWTQAYDVMKPLKWDVTNTLNGERGKGSRERESEN